MANVVRLSGNECCSDAILDRIYVEDQFSVITTGSTVQLQRGDRFYCINVLTVDVIAQTPDYTLLGVFTNCEECLSGITNAVQIETCNFQNTYFVDINSFITLPTIGDIHYINIVDNDGGKQFEECFTVVCYVNTEEQLFNVNSISNPYTGCTECYINNSQVWEVNDCVNGNPYYVSLPPNNDYTNYIITFEISFGEQICGTVSQIIITDSDVTLISILGLSNIVEGGTVSCEDCLSITNEKRIITNCLTNETDVVWGSAFYEGSEVSNLSTEEGCFEVGDLTESAVTINTFLNYDPQPDCQECIQCNGVYYTYSSCTNSGPIMAIEEFAPVPTIFGDGVYGSFTGTTNGNGIGFGLFINVFGGEIIGGSFIAGIGYQIGDTITIPSDLVGTVSDLVITVSEITTTGVIFSFQYVENPIGKSFYIPYLNDCVEITNISNTGSQNYNLLSFEVFDNCISCLNNDFYVWITEECYTYGSNVVVLSSNSFSPGDYVKVLRGSIEFVCHRLVEPYVYNGWVYNTFLSNSVTPFVDCDTCNSGILIGSSIAKCSGGGQQFVNIPIATWIQMAYIDSQSIFVLQKYGQCYGLLNSCPLAPNYSTIYPSETYYNCIDCLYDNTMFPRSANTESILCIDVCTPTGSTVVSVQPPHPVWTDNYGVAVTQLNSVTLGGPNGLNS